MKTIFRILVILVVASLIGGVLYALVNVTGVGARPNSFRSREGGQQFVPGNDPGISPDNNGGHRPGFGGRGDRKRRGGMLGFGFGLIKNLLLVAVIAVIHFKAMKWFAKPKVNR